MVLSGVLVCALAAPRSASADSVTRSCGPDPLANTASVLCTSPSGPCTASTVPLSANIDVPGGGCTFDLGGRAFTVSKTFQMTGAGFIKVINAGNVSITSTGKLKARGDFVLATTTPTPHATPTATPTGGVQVPTPTPTQTFAATGPPGTIQGGVISITSTGTITHAGIIDVSGDSAGEVDLDAVGNINLQSGSLIQGNGIASADDAGYADGGTVMVTSRSGSITHAGALTLLGDAQAAGGEVDFTAAANIDIQQSIDASGGGDDGGEIDIECGDNITVAKTITVDSNVGAGFGGDITLVAGIDTLGGTVPGGSITATNATFRLNGSDSEASSGDGGELDATAAGPLQFMGSGMTIRANGGNLFDGSGGTVCLDTTDPEPNRIGPLDGDITVQGQVVLQSAGDSGSGGSFDVTAGRNFTISATLDTSGADDGGEMVIDAGGSIAVNGVVTAQGRIATSLPGSIDLFAGDAANAGLTITQNILANGGASKAAGDFVSLTGCTVAISPGVKVTGQGGTDPNTNQSRSSEIDVVGLHGIQIGASAQLLANPGGSIFLVHPANQTPVIGSGVVFNPARVDVASSELSPYPNCPVCGDGIRQLGETCDNGAAADGACCNATCTAFTCPTATTTVTPVATHTPTLTATRTATPGGGIVPTATATGAPVATASPTGGPVVTATATAATPTSTPTVTVTRTPTPSITAAPTSTATATATITATPTSTATATATPVASTTATAATATPVTTPVTTPQPSPSPLDATTKKCRAALVSATAALVQAETTAESACHAKIVTAKLPADTDCLSEPKTVLALGKARTKLGAALTKACGGKDKSCGSADDVPLDAIGWTDATCPNVAGGTCTNPTADCAGIATCLTCIADTVVQRGVTLAYGALVASDPKAEKPLNKCQVAIGASTAKLVTASGKSLAKCWATVNAGKAVGTCPAADGKAEGAITTAAATAMTSLCKACGGPDKVCGGADDFLPSTIGFAGTCPSVTPPGAAAPCTATIASVQDVATCLACVTGFDVECATLAAVPALAPYPAECAP